MYPRWITTSSFILLVVFVFNTCLFGVVLSCVLCLHQESQKSSLHKPSKEIMTLQISADVVENSNTQFHWEKEWEFEYLGEMYDVIDSHKEGNRWVFHCKHDTREEILKNRADREAKNNQDNRDSQSKKNLKVHGDYFAAHSTSEFHNVFTILTPFVSPVDFSAESKNIPDPPPWLT